MVTSYGGIKVGNKFLERARKSKVRCSTLSNKLIQTIVLKAEVVGQFKSLYGNWNHARCSQFGGNVAVKRNERVQAIELDLKCNCCRFQFSWQ